MVQTLDGYGHADKTDGRTNRHYSIREYFHQNSKSIFIWSLYKAKLTEIKPVLGYWIGKGQSKGASVVINLVMMMVASKKLVS